MAQRCARKDDPIDDVRHRGGETGLVIIVKRSLGLHPLCSRNVVTVLGFALALAGCGGSAGSSSTPIILSVSLANSTVVLPPNGTPVYLPVIIVAPTETATLTISGLPAGLTESYKESESNPSGLLTLSASPSTLAGTYMPRIIVGSTGQTASLVFTLVISVPAKVANISDRTVDP